MSEKQKAEKHPIVREHPEQRRQQETGREDPAEPGEIGQVPSETKNPKKSEHAA